MFKFTIFLAFVLLGVSAENLSRNAEGKIENNLSKIGINLNIFLKIGVSRMSPMFSTWFSVLVTKETEMEF